MRGQNAFFTLKCYVMKKSSLIQYFLWFLVLFAFLFWSGCSFIGLTLGSISDKNNKKELQVSGWEINKIENDQLLTFVLKNGDSIVGRYRQNVILSDEQYKSLYDETYMLLSQNTSLPRIGDTMELKIINPVDKDRISTIRQPFAGFDYTYVMLKGENNSTKWYPYKNIGSAIIDNNVNIDLHKIQQWVKTGEITSRSFIVTDDNTKINPADIQYISFIKKSGNASLTGFLVGLALDVSILIAMSGSNFSLAIPSSGYGVGGGSCPYIYSYDGNNYRLDSETFGGAIFKAAQKTDIDNLDYLKEYNGYYKLRLTNELDETQYVDEFKLIVADHPEGTQVMPSFDGKLHVLNTLQSPERATDNDGNNVLHLIKSKDEKVWISNPFNRNPEIPGDGRDAMEVEFDKPLYAETVKLAFNVQNTQWAASLQKEMLSLHGNKLQDWYQLMDTSEPARNVFTKAMIREGMLLVQVWDGTKWQIKDYVWEVGPALPKDQVVVLDLKDISGDKLKIRFESTVGFWMINSIGADYSEEMTANIHELTAESAFNQNGKNVKEILMNNDGQYLVMPTTKDKVEISFKAIPLQKNATRTYLLKCSGYYHIHTDETGEPKLALLDKLITEPGAYGQFVLKKLNKELAAWEQ